MNTPGDLRPFTLEIPQTDLDDLAYRLARTRWPEQLPGVGWSYGVDRDYLQDLVDHWRTGYDWRAAEARLNAYDQYVTTIDGQDIHFLQVRSPRSDAIPMIITHGWPSTVLDFTGIIGQLTDPASTDPAFHVVAPSLPGFPFSGPTTEPGWSASRTARAWAELMRRLGHDRYGAQGGDWGSIVAAELGRVDRDHVVGVHLNALATAATASNPDDLETLSEADRQQAEQNQYWWFARSGYATEMSTRPQTIGYALNDSPVGQLAWNLEWFTDFDPTTSDWTPIDRDRILDDVTSYWLTGTATSAARFYRESTVGTWGTRPRNSGVPTAVANFTGDRAIRGLAELSNTIIRWTRYETGGHFASLQAPDLLVADIREFFRTL